MPTCYYKQKFAVLAQAPIFSDRSTALELALMSSAECKSWKKYFYVINVLKTRSSCARCCKIRETRGTFSLSLFFWYLLQSWSAFQINNLTFNSNSHHYYSWIRQHSAVTYLIVYFWFENSLVCYICFTFIWTKLHFSNTIIYFLTKLLNTF